jgi:primosomal protein N' (replication factor Y)
VLLSRKLRDLMVDRFEKREQTILFLNRRGYSTSMVCPDCGWVATCKHCSISLTWHRGDDMLRCHLCGFEQVPPKKCATCSSEKVRWKGFGTQRIEDIVQKVLPKATVVRIDADALKKKDLLRVLLADFRKGKIDVLVGTQMIAKGLDFPNVTLVGLIAADMSLHIPDFRSAERTFQLLVQVSGRAGRGDRAGEVVVQTFIPASAPIQFARRGDFDGFLAEELENRRQYHYPPYRHLIQHLFRGPNQEKVAFYAEQWAKHLEANPIPGVEIRGPAPAPMEKIKDHYRFHLWYFTDSASRVAPLLVALRQGFAKDKDVIDTLDVDPVSLG